ncbi:hypothetical protein [Acinetobacter ursingii]|uniref:hypothetical protein n=1 Tax=Acinetobacter ursingii TaxID=108980 RepID=UPI0021CD3D71|nr:hypothetical protein [Acinetobacter ursingii]MCU4350229.1 hypothetical protein [Acinetobacter ursingii]
MTANVKNELAQALHDNAYEILPEGLYFPRQGILASGEYFDRVNGGEWQRTSNLIVNEGLAHLLNVALGTSPKPAGYFLALFSGATAPAANWTAANFASVASEIVSLTEGYTSATRPVWTPVNTNGNSIDNMASVASVTIATASTLNVTGAALLTNRTKGGTTGVLVSATKYAAARTFQNGDVYEIGYRLSLTV